MDDITAPVQKLEAAPPTPKRRLAQLVKRPPPTLASLEFDIFDRYGRHPGRGLSVERILQIFRQAEAGRPSLQCDLFDDVYERDAHLRDQFDMRITAVAGKQWIIQPGGDAEADVEAARLLEVALRRVANFREMVEHLLTCHLYGWAATEMLWDEIEIDGRRVFAPVWFENVAHRRFAFDEFGEPRLVVKAAEPEGIQLAPGRWLFTARRHRSIPMSGLMRTAVFWSLFKMRAVTNWVLYNERFGIPIPLGTYKDNTPPEEKAALDQAVSKIGTDFWATFLEDCQITSLKTDGSIAPNAVQGAMVDLCNAEISKLVTGATLTSGEGTSAGSYAQATVHENRLYDAASEDAEVRIPQIIAQQLAKPFVEWNGLTGRPPKIKFHLVRETDPQARMAIFQGAMQMGLALDADQVRAEMQLKAVTGESIGGTQPAPDPGPEEKAPAPEPQPARSAPMVNRLAFDPNQPRDADGKWGSGGGGAKFEKRVARDKASAIRDEEEAISRAKDDGISEADARAEHRADASAYQRALLEDRVVPDQPEIADFYEKKTWQIDRDITVMHFGEEGAADYEAKLGERLGENGIALEIADRTVLLDWEGHPMAKESAWPEWVKTADDVEDKLFLATPKRGAK